MLSRQYKIAEKMLSKTELFKLLIDYSNIV